MLDAVTPSVSYVLKTGRRYFPGAVFWQGLFAGTAEVLEVDIIAD